MRPVPATSAARVGYWPRSGFAREQLLAALSSVPGSRLVVVASFEQLLAALPTLDAVVIFDCAPEQAARVVEVLSRPDCRVRWMHFVSAGREGFDAVGIPSGIRITGPAGAVAPVVAEHALALLLAVARNVPKAIADQRVQTWDRVGSATTLRTLEGASLAVVGFGHIGREIALRARSFGMRITAVTRTPHADPLADEVHPLSDLREVLATSDAVALAIALTADTRHLIGRRELAACRRGCIVVNVARGGVLDQTALAAALRSGHLGGAALDVTEPEPLSPDDPLWRVPGLLITPHLAGFGSDASAERIARGAALELAAFVDLDTPEGP